MVETGEFEWRDFLVRWSGEWADAGEDEQSLGERDSVPRRERWLGFEGADEALIVAAEERLGCRLPPSYRAFLEVSDGWRHAGGFVYVLAGTEQVRWHEDSSGLGQEFRDMLDENSTPEEVLQAGVWERGLQLQVESDAMYVLMDPGDTDEAGEWAVHVWAGWRAAPPERYGSFREFMTAMHREFHSLQAHRLGAAFVNDTTRALDAAVEEARLDALRGRYKRAEAVLEKAVAYGRPRAHGLYDQIRRLSGHSYGVGFWPLPMDPVYAPEFLPVLAAEHVRDGRDDRAWRMRLSGADDTVRELADAVLREVRERTYLYTPDGEFGRALDEAREQARWGLTDEAWRIVRKALPQWRPRGPEQLAPIGLLADPFLGPVCDVRERGRELLATPRAGETGDAPVPAGDIDPPGLAWLAEADGGGGGMQEGYRFLLVEGVRPDELPELVGAEGARELRGPESRFEAVFGAHRRRGQDSAPWEDRAITAVGLAGADWSFAFDGQPPLFNGQRFVSPAVVASRGGREGGRALVVWKSPGASLRRPDVFHLSLAQDGEERYSFTVRGDEVAERHGDIPDSLDPDRWFGGGTGEGGLLDAVAGEFGVRLPRFALARGPAYTLTTLSWTRPAEPGEAILVMRRTRPGAE
ncbi:SMI1/KNR4 family protein [Streptomyces sp. 3214.6]|uniref:SMI1/KNR4 family protein n=1 Tax=Streptomyces sp. 3214.6 TaxID=1882757 RepID=UPI00090A5DD6|nr:SMI1/KNR4 family protein [Streptomyces sp. 3214.6]SHH96511.1 SMI1 / KNR4 family (SUKH-1) [Streptomyces sp. 3214.6]